MDPVLSGSLCFLILAIAMYLKFIREQPWSDEELTDHKSSPVDGGSDNDTRPFLHPASPVGRGQSQEQKRGLGQGRQVLKQKKTQMQQLPLQPLDGYAGIKPGRETSSFAVAATGDDDVAASGVKYLVTHQPMRRRTHSGTAASSAMSGDDAKCAVVDSGEIIMDQLPTTIYEGSNYDQCIPQRVSEDSGKNQHRITLDDYDEEMGYVSPPRHEGAAEGAANVLLGSVSFEAENDGFYDLEKHLPDDRALDVAEKSDRDLRLMQIGGKYSGGDLLESPDVADASDNAKTLKTNVERQFVRDVAPPAQMQLEVARKARIPLFLHSPMYVKASAPPLVNEVDTEFTAAFAVTKAQVKQGAGNGEALARDVAELDRVNGAGGGMAEGANGTSVRRKRPKLSKAKSDSLHLDFKELQIDEMIGQGAFGTVHRAKWRGTVVAVKILVCQYLTADILEEFEAEVQIMSILRHPNICLLMGACLEPPTRCLVIEYLPRGSLWNVIRQDVVIDVAKQFGFARDAALGMNYLHSFQPPILHRDLKSPNLLINSSYALKISDFGLARVRARFQTMTGNCGTTQWMAPEVLAAEKYTEKADVFSYGVVVWETVTRQCPYEGLTQIQAALGVLNNNLRPKVPENCSPLFKQLMTLCWASAPERRPSFETVLEILNSSAEGMLLSL
uniref:non-specific serine/threonine protein kinase n=1 Tax=Hyaloperonospora arabidopsidis (strain Emoy2) TaxID=559515 RepID=M4BH68_HYAAE